MAVLVVPALFDTSGVSLKAGLSWPEGFEEQFLDARLLSDIYPRLGEAIWHVSSRASMSAMSATAWWALAACGPGLVRAPKLEVIEAGFVASLDPSLTLFNDDLLKGLPDVPVSPSRVEQQMLDFVGYLLSNGHWALTEGRGTVQDAWHGLAAMLCSVVADPTPLETWLERVLERLATQDPINGPANTLPPPPAFFSLSTSEEGISRAEAWRVVLERLALQSNPFLRDPKALHGIPLA